MKSQLRVLAGWFRLRTMPSIAAVTGIALVIVFACATTVVAHAVTSAHGTHGESLVATTTPATRQSTDNKQAARPQHAAGYGIATRSSADLRPITRRRTPAVPRPKQLVPATLFAHQDQTLRRTQLHDIRQIAGVTAVTVVGDGRATIDGHRANVLSVRPATFRPWTPKLTAASNPLWNSIASGELTASFDMGHGAKLPLGHTVPVTARRTSDTRIGAFASVGMASVDAVVNHSAAHSLGLPQRNGIIVSAPKANPLVVRAAVNRLLGTGAQTNLLQETVVIRDAGEFMTRSQISTILHAAASRIGKPYVWGAAGPNAFDCSGLVQWSFAKAGITMPRVAADQFFSGPHIPYKDARPGDLLYWHYDPTDPTDVDHTAIYIGNGQMLVAPHTGLDVMIQPVPLAHMAGVVRVDPAISSQIGG